MNVLNNLFTITLIFFSFSGFAQQNYLNFVDPFIGTGGHGHTFPGATAPFGMVQLSADTRLTGWDGCSAYHYTDSLVYGFSHTHLSGTGVGDYGDILLMPFTGKTIYNNGYDGNEGYRSKFKKENEKAKPAFYSTFLEDDKIEVKLTTSTRCGYHQYNFEAGGDKKVMLDLEHRDFVTDAYLKKINEYELVGYRHSKAWAENQKLFFIIRFSEPIIESKFLVDGTIENLTETNNNKIKAAFNFGSKPKTLEVKVAISAVDIEGARKNLEAEILDKSFNEVLTETQNLWQKELSKIEVGFKKSNLNETNTEKLTIFYTALYHTMIAPNIFTDVDGRYLGTDFKIHTAKDYTHYTIFSLWDTYRAAHPLYTIIDEKRSNDFINTFLNQYKQGGYLPMWELAANYTGCMIGYHAVPVIADAFIKGINNYDTDLALKAMVDAATANRLGIPSFESQGFLSGEIEAECVSKSLEYSYDDFTIATMASKMGKNTIADNFYTRAQNYKNVFDPETGFMRARLNNQWFSPFNPAEVNFNYTEANAWQYSFYVPQDVTGFIDLLGGETNFENKLDALFSASEKTTGRNQADITGLIGQYAHGNEPSHHIAYLYNYIGKPYKTQKYVTQILNEMYTSKPDGYSGNEDCGQMSAWYVLSALGFYPVCPATEDYIIGAPVFDFAKINLENGKQFTINCENNNLDNNYVASILKNGKAYTKSYLTHRDILSGANFTLNMSNQPDKNFGLEETARPKSELTVKKIVAVPAIFKGEKAFKGNTIIGINCSTKDAIVYYQVNKEAPEIYKEAFEINSNCSITVWAEKENYITSKKATSQFFVMPENRTIELFTKYASHYSAGGDNALIDQIKGGNDFRVGNWQGYEGVNLEAIINLGEASLIKEISVGFLQDENSWIFMPIAVEFYISDDGTTFNKADIVKNQISPKEKGSIIKEFKLEEKQSAKYVKVVAVNRGVCPPYHKGAGSKCWIFVDEISVK